jgi:hypothetical protein
MDESVHRKINTRRAQMSTQTCTDHGEDVVVYQANVPRLQQCPLCVAENQVRGLESTIDSLQDDIKDLESECADLKDEISSLKG